MKKVLLAALGFLVSVAALSAAPLLIEAYQEGQIYIPEGESGEFTVVEISVSLDSACYVQFVTGGNAVYSKSWLEMDNDSLPFVIYGSTNRYWPGWVNLTYATLVEPGEHTVSLLVSAVYDDVGPTTFREGYLQALIFLPDTATAVAEQPVSDAEPRGNTPSLISKGPFVHVAGASELVDATGRVIENAIEDDKVFISNLPTGTYFARDADRTVVKIVKVD
jgi:hypothetical protein